MAKWTGKELEDLAKENIKGISKIEISKLEEKYNRSIAAIKAKYKNLDIQKSETKEVEKPNLEVEVIEEAREEKEDLTSEIIDIDIENKPAEKLVEEIIFKDDLISLDKVEEFKEEVELEEITQIDIDKDPIGIILMIVINKNLPKFDEIMLSKIGISESEENLRKLINDAKFSKDDCKLNCNTCFESILNCKKIIYALTNKFGNSLRSFKSQSGKEVTEKLVIKYLEKEILKNKNTINRILNECGVKEKPCIIVKAINTLKSFFK